MGYVDQFGKKDPIFIGRLEETGMLASESEIEKQNCPNWRCRGNIDNHCVYRSRQYNICGDKGAVNDDFFKFD